LTIVLGVTLALAVFFPAYWTYSMPALNETTKTGVTIEGFPWIGSENPRIVIEEFTDYKCFQCKKMHFFLRQLIDQYPEKIQLVHRHFPMDHIVNPLVKEPFHEGSGALALLSIYAKKENRFWEFNDMLFEKVAGETQFETKEMAETFGFDPRAFTMSLNSRESRITLNRDIIDGIKLGITGTPAYLIDGHVYQGYIPPEAIKKIME
jgi:protein-disulfide isomerase